MVVATRLDCTWAYPWRGVDGNALWNVTGRLGDTLSGPNGMCGGVEVRSRSTRPWSCAAADGRSETRRVLTPLIRYV